MSKHAPLPAFHPAVIWSCWFWTGLIPKAPGTMGSLAALPFAYGLNLWFGGDVLIIATLFVFLTGWWSTAVYVKATGRQDPGEVVVDEVAGQWIPLLIAGTNPVYFVIGFALFRLFDILKPWPIGWLDKKVKGAFGVMIDDILAGIFALVVLDIITNFVSYYVSRGT